MIKINLYKDGNLVLSKDGIREDLRCKFDNITYDLDKLLLIREDNNFKYELDFNEESALVCLKAQDYLLDLNIKVINKEITDNYHKISYSIESDNKISNDLEIILK